MSIDPKRHIEEYGVKALDSGTLRNLRMIAKIRYDQDAEIRACLPDADNTAIWDEAMGQDASDNRWVIEAVEAELKERGHAL